MSGASEELYVLLPDWVKNKPIRIFAGRELVAEKALGEPLKVKTIRCNLCGECCRHCPPDWPWGSTPDGVCAKLIFEKMLVEGKVRERYVCGLRGDVVPFTCCKGRHEDHTKCVIRFAEAP